jgi:hypothetical protein
MAAICGCAMARATLPPAPRSSTSYFGPKAPAGKEGNWIQTVPEQPGEITPMK